LLDGADAVAVDTRLLVPGPLIRVRSPGSSSILARRR
jgi:hypothetical protein